MRTHKHDPSAIPKRMLSFALTLLLTVGGIPAPAIAEALMEANTESVTLVSETTETGTIDSSDEGLQNEDLLNAYVEKRINDTLPQSSGSSRLRTRSASSSLEGNDLVVYNALRPMIAEVAAGTRTSTVFEIPIEDLGYDGPWTAADLGVDYLFDGSGVLNPDAVNAAVAKIQYDMSSVIDALLADCPYDLYWFDKTQGYKCDPYEMSLIKKSGGEWKLSVKGPATISMVVASEYSASGASGTTDMREGIMQPVETAIAKAQQIVDVSEGLSTYDRMKAYKDAICAEVDYNHDAADDPNTPYGNPWQLIWVFDNDESTSVVCEGYSKAFKYLCDLTWPAEDDPVESLLASGYMAGGVGAGAHMWNVVRMDDGKSYLVDVTNCDDGSIGYPYELFMAYGPSGSVEDGYTFSANGQNISYAYDDDTKNTFGNDLLTISETAYIYAVTFDTDGGGEVAAQSVPEGGKATRPADPTRDGHRFLGWYQVTGEGALASDAFDFDAPVTGDVALRARWAAPVTLEARMVDADGRAVAGSVTYPDGNGTALFPGDEATLTAPRVPGYNFAGWFAEGDPNTNLCADRAYTLTVGGTTAFVARYEELQKVTITVESSKRYSVNGSDQIGKVIEQYQKGVDIALVASGGDFVCWKDSMGKVVSTNPEFSFTTTSSESYEAEYREIVEDKALVVFRSYYGQVMAQKNLAENEAMNLPDLPTRNGYDTLGWDMDGDGAYDAETDTLDAAIGRGLRADDKTVTVLAVYRLRERTFTVAVSGGSGGGEYHLDDHVYVKADAPEDGRKFSHWENESGTKVSYNATYDFHVEKNVALTAVYVADTAVVEAVGTTVIENMYKDEANKKLIFVSRSSVPAGCTIQKAGVIATDNEQVANSGGGFNDTTARFVRGDAWNGTGYQYTWAKGKLTAGDTWYVRAYLVYTDLNGNTRTVYGEMVSQTF